MRLSTPDKKMINPLSKEYETVIVGGGIAGLCTAEIFARSGIKTLLVEKAEKLCMETSGLHHEWFHFGSLYSIFPNNQFLRTMVGGIDDLLLYYRDFESMNLRIDGCGKLLTVAKSSPWIRKDNLKYVITTTDDEDFSLSNPDNSSNFMYKMGMKFLWNKAIKQFVARHNRFYKYDWRKGCSSHYIPKAGWLDYSEKFINKFDDSEISLNPETHVSMESYDSPMYALHIISDLTRSFLSYGGEIRTATEFEEYQNKRDGKRVILSDGSVVKTKRLILASGNNLAKQTKNKIKVKSVVSPLIIVYPRVCSSNVVRLTPFMDQTINHLKHSINGKDYSLIGGGYFANKDDNEAIEKAGFDLLNKAKAIFSRVADAEVVHLYYGTKTEIISSVKKRNYLYRIEKVDNDVYVTVPGKFSLAFSLAVNTFLKIMGHYPNTYVTYDKEMDVSQYVGLTKHKALIDRLENVSHELKVETVY